MEETTLLIAAIAAFIIGFGIVSGRLQKTVITAPMVFTLFGLLISSAMLDLAETDIGGELINLIAEFTLILVLFTDASRIDLKLLRREHDIPVRLLAIGLPLTIIAGALVAAVLFNFVTIWEAFILAVILAPTDAALGQAVVSSPKVPVRIRQALNVESGLNDGIALPFLLFFIAAAGASETLATGYWIRVGAGQIILGPIAGIAVGYLGGKLINWAEEKNWMANSFQRLAALGLALLAYSLAEVIGGNGFIAAFCAGLVLGNLFRDVCHRLYEFAEAEGALLMLLTFMIFGAIMVPVGLAHFNWTIALYAVLSLTVIRIIPVAISLIGMKLQTQTIAFLGWFGPRGIASIIYGLLIVEEEALQGRDTIMAVMIVTVLFSILAHGVTAVPWANHYGAQAEAIKDIPGIPELRPVTEMPVRIRHT